MDYKIKLAGKLPKGDLDGWSDRVLAEEIGERRIRRAAEQPLVAIVLYEVEDTGLGKNGAVTTKLVLSRVQPVQTEEGLRAAEALLSAEYTDQHGCQQPYEVQSLSSRAFVGLPRTTSEIDQREAAEADLMSPTDELRRHLERVHGHTNAGELTALEAQQLHESDHAGDMPGELDHDQEWRGWTRVDLEAAAAEADGESGGNPDGSLLPDVEAALDIESGLAAIVPGEIDGEIRSHGPTKPPYGSPERAQHDQGDELPDAPTAFDNVHPLFSSDRT